MARKGPWMIEVGRRCGACGGTGQIPDHEEKRGVESTRTPGGVCLTCRGNRWVAPERVTLTEFYARLQAATAGTEDLGSNDDQEN
jgi:hypothetical protein